jgi:hypothetical protein
MLYYQKPADALTATGGTGGSGDVAMAAGPDTPARTPDLPPIPQTAPQDPPAQPMPGGQPPSTSQKQPPPKETIYDTTPKQPLPRREYIFDMYDDATLERAIIKSVQEENRRRDPMLKFSPDDPSWRFPALPVINPLGLPYVTKAVREGYEPRKAVYEPLFVVHRRLHFEEKNTERYGWDMGILQPFLSTAYFYKDVLLWPNSLASGLEIGFWDTNAGKCLPGSPVPYYLYPPGLTITGMLFEGGIITGTGFILHPVNASPFIAPAAGQ